MTSEDAKARIFVEYGAAECIVQEYVESPVYLVFGYNDGMTLLGSGATRAEAWKDAARNVGNSMGPGR
jgi:hypothetical protein